MFPKPAHSSQLTPPSNPAAHRQGRQLSITMSLEGHSILMELVDGFDLGKLVGRCGPLAVADACELIRQSAERQGAHK